VCFDSPEASTSIPFPSAQHYSPNRRNVKKIKSSHSSREHKVLHGELKAWGRNVLRRRGLQPCSFIFSLPCPTPLSQ